MPPPAIPPLPNGSKAKLAVSAGLRKGKTYGLKEGEVTYLGRMGPLGVDIDISEQENPGVSVKVNRFALIWFQGGIISIADAGTRIGVLVNGTKVPPKTKLPLKAGDKIKVGKVELEVKTVVKKATGVQK
jgi:FHA domain